MGELTLCLRLVLPARDEHISHATIKAEYFVLMTHNLWVGHIIYTTPSSDQSN